MTMRKLSLDAALKWATRDYVAYNEAMMTASWTGDYVITTHSDDTPHRLLLQKFSPETAWMTSEHIAHSLTCNPLSSHSSDNVYFVLVSVVEVTATTERVSHVRTIVSCLALNANRNKIFWWPATCNFIVHSHSGSVKENTKKFLVSRLLHGEADIVGPRSIGVEWKLHYIFW